MTLADSARQRADWIKRAAHIQLAIADLRTLIDATMHGRPALHAATLLAQADVHLEMAAQELADAASNVNSII